MAGPSEDSVLEGELTCPVCLELFSDPHLLACGHNLCLACVRGLRRRAERGRFRCPECRESVRCSGPLQKNYRLANIAEDYRRRGRPPRPSAAPPTPPHCDYCSPGDAAPAVKTCLQCEVSMCAEHLRPHLERPAFREHPLTEPLGDVRHRKCPAHDELYRYYCLDERLCVCNACTIEGRHAGHSIKTLKNTMRDLKESLEVQLQKVNRKLSRTDRFLQQRADAERDSQRFVEEAELQLGVAGQRLQGLLGGFLSALRDSVRDHGGAGPEVELQQNLSRISEDRTRLQEVQSGLQTLLQDNDPFHFLQEYQSSGKKLQITELIHSVCVENSGEEDEEGGAEEEEEEEEEEEDLSDTKRKIHSHKHISHPGVLSSTWVVLLRKGNNVLSVNVSLPVMFLDEVNKLSLSVRGQSSTSHHSSEPGSPQPSGPSSLLLTRCPKPWEEMQPASGRTRAELGEGPEMELGADPRVELGVGPGVELGAGQ
ncbi:hypothetical protein JZ751_003460, partial [Albula glossodonta]